jgi:hypothetical protein
MALLTVEIEISNSLKSVIFLGDNFSLVLVTQQTPNNINSNSSNNSTNSSINEKSFMQHTRDVGRDMLKTQVWSFGSINKGKGLCSIQKSLNA